MPPLEAIRGLTIPGWRDALDVLVEAIGDKSGWAQVQEQIASDIISAKCVVHLLKTNLNAQEGKKAFQVLLALLTPPSSPRSTSEGFAVVNSLQNLGLHHELIVTIKRLEYHEDIVELGFQCLSTLYALSSDQVMIETLKLWRQDASDMRTILAVRNHYSSPGVQDKFVLLLLNLTARCPTKTRQVIVEGAFVALWTIAFPACSSADSKLVENICGALHNLCFDDSQLVEELKKRRTYELASKVITSSSDSEWTKASAGMTLLADLSMSTQEYPLPLTCVKLVRDTIRRFLMHEYVVTAGMKALERLSVREDVLKGLATLDEALPPDEMFLTQRVIASWKDRSLDIAEPAVAVLLNMLSSPNSNKTIRSRRRNMESLKQLMNGIVASALHASRVQLYFRAKRVLTLLAAE